MENSWVIYCRVSSRAQNLQTQIDQCVARANAMGVEAVLYVEKESTRRTRPVKNILLKELRGGLYEGMIIYKLDRYARSATELILEMTELIASGIQVVSVKENLDFSTPTGRLQLQMLSILAEFERDIISSRVKDGMDRARSEGKSIGRPKGSKDKKQRKKLGYYVREEQKRLHQKTTIRVKVNSGQMEQDDLHCPETSKKE